MRRLVVLALIPLALACARPGIAPIGVDDDPRPPAPDAPAPVIELAVNGPPVVLPGVPSAPNPAAREISVKPLFFVPAGAPAPTDEDRLLLAQHLQLSQHRYRELLGGQDTFRIANTPDVITAPEPPAYFHEGASGELWGYPRVAAAVLDHYGLDRFSAPYVFVVVFQDTLDDRFPGHAAPANGGFDTGAAFVNLPGNYMDAPNLQSTLLHELGHAFGLWHADVLGEDMATSASIMAYNLAHWSDGLSLGPTPGILLDKERYALSFNRRLFPNLVVAPPPDYGPIYVPPIPAFPVEGHPYEILVETAADDAGHVPGSPAGAVQGRVLPSDLSVGYDPESMWHSDLELVPGSWVRLELTLPMRVAFDGLLLGTEHSGEAHPATGVRVEVDGRRLLDTPLAQADAFLAIERVEAERVVVELQVGESGCVVLRGLQLFDGARDLFPPLLDAR